MIVREQTSLEEVDRFFAGELAQMGDLGFSFRKLYNKARAPFVKLIKADPLLSRLYKVHFKAREKIKKRIKKWMPAFIKAAPWLAIAAEALNFIVPGLGVLVAVAISAAATAYKLDEAKRMKAKITKMQKTADAEANKEIDESTVAADKSLMDAYDKGGAFFQKNYNTSREQFKAMPIDERVRFLNIAIYDQHTAEMAKTGVMRDIFAKMTVGEQADALAKMANKLPGAPGVYTTPPLPEPPTENIPEAPGAVLLTEEQDFDSEEIKTIKWALAIGGSALALGIIAYLLINKKKGRRGRS